MIDSVNNTITFSEFPYLVDVEIRIIKAIKDMISDADFVEKLTILILEQKVNNEYHLLKYIMENY